MNKIRAVKTDIRKGPDNKEWLQDAAKPNQSQVAMAAKMSRNMANLHPCDGDFNSSCSSFKMPVTSQNIDVCAPRSPSPFSSDEDRKK